MDLQVFIQQPYLLKQAFEENREQMLAELVEQIGHPNAYIREQVVFPIWQMAIHEQYLTEIDVQNVIETIVNEELLVKNCALVENDDVFTRVASSLWINVALNHEKSGKYLQNMVYFKVLSQAINWLGKERDARGFIDEQKGWADAIGSAAELTLACMKDERFEQREMANVLQAIRQSLWNGSVYTNNEDERFVKIIFTCIHKGAEEALLIEWVEQLFDQLERVAYAGYTQQWFTARTNLLQLMKTLYFHLKFSHQYEQLRATTSIFIQRWLKI